MDSKQLGDKIKKDSIDENEFLSSLGPELFNLIKNNMEKVQKMDDGEEKERLVKEILIAINKKNDTNAENDSTAFKYQNIKDIMSETVESENARKSYKQIEKASTILVYGWVVNNLIGTISIIFSIYFIWWKYHMGFLGIFMFLFVTWIINGLILPAIFGIFNQPFAMKARGGAIDLEDMGIIDAELSFKLNNTKVEYWPKYIIQGLSDENLKKIFPSYKNEK